MANAFLAALRSGDLEALVGVLNPELVVCTYLTAALPGFPAEVRGASRCAKQAVPAVQGAGAARIALVEWLCGPRRRTRGGRFRVLRFNAFTIAEGTVIGI